MPSLTTIANAAARTLGIMDSGGSLSAAQLADALIAANEILDNWSSEGKMVISELLTTFPLVSGTNNYTIGPAQTINIARPVRINAATLLLAAGPSSPVQVLQNVAEWEAIPDREGSSYKVAFLFYDRGNPTGKVYVAPKPLGGTIEIANWIALAQFADATTSLTLLPGHELALRLELARMLAPEYSVAFSPESKEQLAMALATLYDLNSEHSGLVSRAATVAA